MRDSLLSEESVRLGTEQGEQEPVGGDDFIH